jgi:hypothetical protein
LGGEVFLHMLPQILLSGVEQGQPRVICFAKIVDGFESLFRFTFRPKSQFLF